MSTENQPYKIFVSHIAEEAALGIAVKDGLEDAFSERVRVFVSSDPRDNPGGDQWLERIKRELVDPYAKMLISLVSVNSVGEPWISIEVGAAWILDRAVFPLCHARQKLHDLPRPLQDFGGADLQSDDAADRLIKAVEKATGLQAPKRWDRARFLREMREVSVVPSATGGRDSGKKLSDLPSEQVSILQLLAVLKNDNVDEISQSQAPRGVGLTPSVFTYHAYALSDKELIYIGYGGEGEDYSITPAGLGWLIEHGEMPPS
jgi:hypothetical protein